MDCGLILTLGAPCIIVRISHIHKEIHVLEDDKKKYSPNISSGRDHAIQPSGIALHDWLDCHRKTYTAWARAGEEWVTAERWD